MSDCLLLQEIQHFGKGSTNKLGYYGNQGASEPVAQVTYMYTDRVYYNSNIADMDSYMWAGRG